MCVSRTIEALGKLLARVFCFRKEPMAWTVQYEANDLPESATPAWNVGFDPDPLVTSTREIVDGQYHFSGMEEGFFWQDLTWVQGTAEARINIVTADTLAGGTQTVAFCPCTQSHDIRLFFYTDGINVSYQSSGAPASESIVMDTTGYHTYRVLSGDGWFSVWVDGVEAMNQVLVNGSIGAPNLYFDDNYDDTQLFATEYYIDYVYYDTTGAYEPGAADSGSNDSCYHYFV